MNILALLLPSALAPHQAHHPVHALGLLQKVFIGDGPLHIWFSQDVIKKRGNNCCNLTDLISFQTKWKFPAGPGLFLMPLCCHSGLHKTGQRSRAGSSKPLAYPAVWRERRCLQLSCGITCPVSFKVPKAHRYYCIKQYMETPAVTVLLHWRNVATCPGEQHFILAEMNLWMCGTTVGCLNSQFSKKIFAALRVVVVGVATKSKFSPVIPYMPAAL